MAELLLSVMKVFVWNSPYAFIVAAAFIVPCFLSVYSKLSKLICAVVSGLWLAYGIWEAYMTAWRSPTGDMAIRVDVLFIGPVVLSAALIGLMTIVLGYRRAA